MSITKLPSGKYQVIWRVRGANGKRIKRKSTMNEHGKPFKSLAEARIYHDERINEERKARLRNEIILLPSHRSITDVIQYYKGSGDYKKLRGSSKDRYEKIIKIFVNWCQSNHVFTVKEFTKEKARDFESYLHEKYTPKGIRDILILCSAIFQEELRRDNAVINVNYLAGLKRPKILRDEIRIFSDKELEFIFTHTQSTELRSIFIVLLYTGMRPSELINLKHKNIEHNKILIRGSKTYKGNRDIPLVAEARKAIWELAKITSGKEYLLNGDKPYGEKILTNRYARKRNHWSKHMPSLSSTSLYDFRHTFGSLLLQKGVSIAVIADLLGHEDIRTTQRWYARLTESDKVKGIKKLEGYNIGGHSGDT